MEYTKYSSVILRIWPRHHCIDAYSRLALPPGLHFQLGQVIMQTGTQLSSRVAIEPSDVAVPARTCRTMLNIPIVVGGGPDEDSGE